TPSAINLTVREDILKSPTKTGNLLPVNARITPVSSGTVEAVGWTGAHMSNVTADNNNVRLDRNVAPSSERAFYTYYVPSVLPATYYSLELEMYITTPGIRSGSAVFLRRFNSSGHNIGDFAIVSLTALNTGEWININANG